MKFIFFMLKCFNWLVSAILMIWLALSAYRISIPELPVSFMTGHKLFTPPLPLSRGEVYLRSDIFKSVELRVPESQPDDIDSKILDISTNQIKPDQIPHVSSSKHSRFAYVTLIHGIDNTFKYRGFIYNTLIMKKALYDHGSREDFICLIGFSSDYFSTQQHIFQSDFDLLTSYGIQLHYLPRLSSVDKRDRDKISFAEMALLKVTPWSFTHYKKIQFFDGDLMPYDNMDCLFTLPGDNTFNTGLASPLNSGWFVATPNMDNYVKLIEMAKVRLVNKWDEEFGWGQRIPPNLYFRGSDKSVKKYDFNGASLDQGLLLNYFVMNHGNVTLLDTKFARIYTSGYKQQEVSLSGRLQCCEGKKPMSFFAHFTGRNKPWLQRLKDARKSDSALQLWAQRLDSLKLEVNSSTIHLLGLGSSLGYFYPNK